MRLGLMALVAVVVIAAVAALNALFIVDAMQQALVLQFGEVKQRIRTAGLNAKIPLIQDVLYLDKRILDLNVPAQELIAKDQKRLVVDAFLRYRIRDPELFYQTVNNVDTAKSRLATFVTGSLRAVLADATFQEIVRDDRANLMQRIKTDVAGNAERIGVDVVDVRIRRADLPEENSAAIFNRMRTERQQEATEIRAQGAEAAQKKTAAADRTAVVLKAEAERDAQQVRGEGDKLKTSILATAYGYDPEFAAFYRTMQLYETALKAQDTRLILSPTADVFRYFNNPAPTLLAPQAAVEGDGAVPVPGQPTVGGDAAALPAPPPAPDAGSAPSSDGADAGSAADPGGPGAPAAAGEAGDSAAADPGASASGGGGASVTDEGGSAPGLVGQAGAGATGPGAVPPSSAGGAGQGAAAAPRAAGEAAARSDAFSTSASSPAPSPAAAIPTAGAVPRTGPDAPASVPALVVPPAGSTGAVGEAGTPAPPIVTAPVVPPA